MRLVSLVPSVTETLSSWDRTPVACTRFCERDDLEHVGGTKDPDVSRIAELAPDVVVMDRDENRREDYEALVRVGLTVVAHTVRSLADVDSALTTLATHVGVAWSPEPRGRAGAVRRRVFVPIWRNPYLALGSPTYGTSLLAHLGLANVYDDGPYPSVTLEEARQRRPDAVLAPSEPYHFTERQRGELSTVAPVTYVDGHDLFWWGVRTGGALARLRAQLT